MKLPALVGFVGFVLVLGTSVRGDTWPRFRGSNGAGVARVNSVPSTWTEEDFNWRVELPGVGHSSPVIWQGKIFLTSGDEESGTRFVLCLDSGDGRIVWQREFPSETHRKHSLNSFASATPAADELHVYCCWATPEEFVVLALDHGGREVWRRDLGPFKSGHGFGVSPIRYEDLLIVPNDQEGDSSYVALDRESGKTVWSVPRDTRVTYSTPCVYRREGWPTELILTNWSYGIQAVDPETGRTNWQAKVFGKEQVETAIGSPVVAGDLIIGCAGWLTREKRVVAVRPEKVDGKVVAKEVYRFERAAPLSTTPLVVGDLLFLWADEGIVTCADARTGERHWLKRVGGQYYGSPVCVGDYVYCMSTGGDCVVLRASEEYELVARNPAGGPSHSTPAVADGRMYLRTFSHLVSLGGE